ncbi:MAG: TetR/AcrR family transcriptional regulator [Betaproteobacteria bacterium]|nr:TetR/AcrR family transcriptional regulator [Betaproteobacteria bacterium]
MSETQEQCLLNECATPDRVEARRRQILAAASECFCQCGFHAASMDRIAKTAGMSVGHIYHYFRNKEAIIAAIVEQDLQYRLQKIALIEAGRKDGDIFAAITASIGQGVDDLFEPYRAALLLECMAEATRNSQVAALVQNADKISRKGWQEVTHRGRNALGLAPDPYAEIRAEVISAIFEGLSMRLVRNPGVNREMLVDFLRNAVLRLLEIE